MYKNMHHIFINGIRRFNKAIFNRITLTFAEGDVGPFSVIYHVGRRSGRSYRTPVLATYTGDTIVIPLSYGENVDWLRNVIAQGGCEIVRKKKRVRAVDPRVIEAPDALALLPAERQRLFERFKLEKFLRLRVVEKV
jgi:deazaflavin-dependent oxidoreductase (nitroreductase family)